MKITFCRLCNILIDIHPQYQNNIYFKFILNGIKSVHATIGCWNNLNFDFGSVKDNPVKIKATSDV